LVVLVVVFAVPLAIVAEQSCSGSAAAGSSDKPLDLAPEPRPSRRY
jgi:hypothetical protein